MSTPMLERIVEITSRYNMFGPADRSRRAFRLGVAVSGGVDSVALLHALVELRERLHLELSVVHVNHRLRGEASEEDERFTREMAARLGLRFHGTVLSRLSGNIEEAARIARIRFFQSLVAEGTVDRVATGHTANDQAETVLFRFLRGSGTAGLRGILPETGEGLVRPLLGITRQEVESFARARGLAWRTDETNASLAFRRNRIRHELLPALQRDYNPALADQLGHVAEMAREEEDCWRELLEPVAEASLREWRGSILVDCAVIQGLHVALQRRLLRLAFARVKGELRQIGFGHVEAVREVALRREGHGRVQIPGLVAERSFGWLRVREAGAERGGTAGAVVAMPGETRLAGGSRVVLEPWGIQESGYNEDSNEVLVCEPGPGAGSLVLRYWQPGDVYQPAGFSRPRKVKEMFQAARIPLWERRFWPILESGSGIIWSRQFGLSESARAESVRAARDPEARVFRLKLLES